MHINSFNLKEFNIVNQQSISSCQLEAHMIIQCVVTKSHEDGSDDGDSRHVCIIAVFLLVRLLYLLIHSLDYLFRPIQILTVLTGLIDLVVVPPSIACCSSNPPPKPTPSQC